MKTRRKSETGERYGRLIVQCLSDPGDFGRRNERLIKVKYATAFVSVLFLILVGCTNSPFLCGFGPSNQFKATCRIRVSDGQGSGTLIAVNQDEALVLSCRHVGQKIDAVSQFEWPSAGDQKTVGRVLANVAGSSFNNDLALFICDRPKGIEPIQIAKFDPANGPWTAVGYKGDQCYLAIGDKATETDGLITVNCPWTHGMSGCGLLDKNGCIVGVIVASNMKTWGVCSDGIALTELVKRYTN